MFSELRPPPVILRSSVRRKLSGVVPRCGDHVFPWVPTVSRRSFGTGTDSAVRTPVCRGAGVRPRLPLSLGESCSYAGGRLFSSRATVPSNCLQSACLSCLSRTALRSLLSWRRTRTPYLYLFLRRAPQRVCPFPRDKQGSFLAG